MTAAIPASAIVTVNPGVISAGGSALDLGGLFLTSSTRTPIGSVVGFPTAATVGAYFGLASAEYAQATIYFNGYNNSFAKPALLGFYQYPTAAVPAYLRGGSVASLTLAQLQAITPGTLTVTINGVVKTSASINLSAVASFSAAATAIQTALAAYDAVVTASIATTTMTVTAVASGTLAVGQTISGTGVTAGTTITALGTGTGGTGTYTVSVSQTVSSTSISAGPALVTYDSTSGAFIITGGTPGVTGTIGYGGNAIATSLKLTAATGAVTSQGAAIGVPGTSMDAVVAMTQNFASFATVFEPSTGDKVLFSAWNSGKLNRYAYVMWTTNVAGTLPNPTTTALYQILAAGYGGTIPIYTVSGVDKASFVMGYIASLDFGRLNGRATMAFRSQDGLVPDVTDAAIAAQLEANGYNYYGTWATANDAFSFLYPGSVTGAFTWVDSYVNQIWINNGLQLAMMTLLTELGSIPYNDDGYALISAAAQDPINAALNFGAIRAGVTLSALQTAEVNTEAGADIANTLQERGWYFQVQDASPIVRAARGSPPITLWYTDGQSVQRINLSSLEVQ